MGGLFSRQVAWGSYEKGFEKIENETKKIQVCKAVRRKWITSYMNRSFSLFVMTVMASVAHITWVQRQPSGSFTVSEHLSRSAISVVAPLLVWLVYGFLKGSLVFLEGRDNRRLKKLGESKKKMVKELKDITLFDKTSALIKKFGDDEVLPVKVVQINGHPRPHANKAMAKGGSSAGSTALMGTAAAAMQGAGKALFPVLDHIAKSVIGDNPQLLDDIRKVQKEAASLKEENERLRSEVQRLREKYDMPTEEGEEEEEEQSTAKGETQQSEKPASISATAESCKKENVPPLSVRQPGLKALVTVSTKA